MSYRRIVRKNELPSVPDTDLPIAVAVIDERIGRSAIPMEIDWPEKSFEIDAEEMRHASELRRRERCGTAFVPIEDVPDPDSLIAIEDQWEVREQEDEEECELFIRNLRDLTTGTVRCLPKGIRKIIGQFSLPSNKWERLSSVEKRQRKRAIQRSIERFYLKQGHS